MPTKVNKRVLIIITKLLVQSKYEHKFCNDVRILQQRLAEEHTPESHGFT